MIIVHGVVVGPKCSYIEDEMEKGITSFKFDSDKETIENFFRLVYGHKLFLTSNKLFKIWLLASNCNYTKSFFLRDILIKNVSQLDIESKIQMIRNINVIPGEIVKNLSLREIKEMSSKISDPEILRLFVLESISRYGADTKSLKEHNNKLNIEIQKLQPSQQTSQYSDIFSAMFGQGHKYGQK